MPFDLTTVQYTSGTMPSQSLEDYHKMESKEELVTLASISILVTSGLFAVWFSFWVDNVKANIYILVQ